MHVLEPRKRAGFYGQQHKTRQCNKSSHELQFSHTWGREGPLTARLRMETGLSLEVKSTCTSPVLGSSISPPSPATLDLSPTSTSAAATSNCTQANARIQEKTVDIAAEFVLLHWHARWSVNSMSSKGGSPFLDLQRNKSLRVKWNINVSGITRGRYSAGMRRSLSERASSKLCKSSRATCKDFGFCNKLSLSQISTIDHKQVRTQRLGR